MSTPALPPQEPEITDKPWARPVQKRLTDWMRQVRDILATQKPARHAKTHMVGGGDALPIDKLTLPGDLLTISGDDYARLGVGSNGQVLTADNTASKGVKWADAAGGTSDSAMLYAFYMGN